MGLTVLFLLEEGGHIKGCGKRANHIKNRPFHALRTTSIRPSLSALSLVRTTLRGPDYVSL